MEKSWENFWTTGKVEDYLIYRNRVTTSESEKKQERNSDVDQWSSGSTKEKDNSSWKGFT